VWTPQQSVNIALLISAAVLVLCVVLALLPFLRRRKRRRSSAANGAGPEADDDTLGAAPGAPPVLVASWDDGTPGAGWATSLIGGALYGALAGFISQPLIGALVALGVVVVLRVPRTRLVLGVVATGLVLVTGVSIMIGQAVDPARANGGWPSGFGFADGLAWAGVLFLGADAVVELMSRVRRRNEDSASADGPIDGSDRGEGEAVDLEDVPVR